jgi:hypothetical protein
MGQKYGVMGQGGDDLGQARLLESPVLPKAGSQALSTSLAA